ncbi:hypothetical protein [Archaeoglobus sp.]
MYRQAQTLADAVRHLEFATTKFYEVPTYKDIAEELEAIQIKVYERMGLIKEREVRELEDDGLIEAQEEVKEEQPIWITESIGYYYDEAKDQFVIVKKDPIKPVTLKRIDREDLMKLWNSLPSKFTEIDLRKAMNELGLRLKRYSNYILRIFTHVTFDGELRTEGKELFVVKPNEFRVSEEVKKQLAVEKELIDSTGWGK